MQQEMLHLEHGFTIILQCSLFNSRSSFLLRGRGTQIFTLIIWHKGSFKSILMCKISIFKKLKTNIFQATTVALHTGTSCGKLCMVWARNCSKPGISRLLKWREAFGKKKTLKPCGFPLCHPFFSANPLYQGLNTHLVPKTRSGRVSPSGTCNYYDTCWGSG